MTATDEAVATYKLAARKHRRAGASEGSIFRPSDEMPKGYHFWAAHVLERAAQKERENPEPHD